MIQISIEPLKPMKQRNCTPAEDLIHSVLTPTPRQIPVLNEYLKKQLDNEPKNKIIKSVEII